MSSCPNSLTSKTTNPEICQLWVRISDLLGLRDSYNRRAYFSSYNTGMIKPPVEIIEWGSERYANFLPCAGDKHGHVGHLDRQECGTSGSKQEDTRDEASYWQLQGSTQINQRRHFGTVSVKWNQMNCPLWLVVWKGSPLKAPELCSAPSAKSRDCLHKTDIIGLLKDPGTIHPSVTL